MVRREKKNNSKGGRSIFRRIIRPLLILTVLDTLILVAILEVGGVLRQTRQNSYELLQKQLNNRQSYLQSQMVDKWMKLDDLSERINRRTWELICADHLDLETLDSKPSTCAPLVTDVIDQLISELYAKQVSGIYLVFNTHDLQQDVDKGIWNDKTGIYIRDNDPLSASSELYADLLLECAPVSVVQSMNLSTDSRWEQKFKFDENHPYGPWLTVPYQTARSAKDEADADEYGYWSIKDDNFSKNSLTYSIPLILPDGTVYGVLGVEMLTGYLNSQMPYAELNKEAVYALFLETEVSDTEGGVHGTVCAVNGRNEQYRNFDFVDLDPSEYGGYETLRDGVRYEVALSQLAVYSRNAPFENQHWYVFAAVPASQLFAFTTQVGWLLILTIAAMLISGFVCALLTGWHIARPVVALRRELDQASQESIPQLSKTGITEVDDFSTAITDLSRDVINSSRRFLSIMEMSSIDMGGYEMDEQDQFLFVTDNFFALLGHSEISPNGMSLQEFKEQLAEIDREYEKEPIEKGSLYVVDHKDGNIGYIHIQETRNDNHSIGVVEDVTMQVLERKRIEHERDYDILTGIYNRRAFYRDAARLLETPETLGTAVMIMIDLDNLKILNDTYGHEWGDRYIRAGAKCIQTHTPKTSVVARVSGDEFNLMLYGFQDRKEALNAVDQLHRGFEEACFALPDGSVRPIGASGGVAFVGEDTTDLKQLIRYADFAMYLVKNGRKGLFGVFDQKLYHASEIEQKKHRAFKRVIREDRVRYVFQPIVSAQTGEIFAVEALMRVKDDTIENTEEFLRIARQENMLDEIEHLTWDHALTSFHRLIETGVVHPDTKVFINSQVSQILNPSEQELLIERFGDIRENTVMEVVETDDYSVEFAKLRDELPEMFASDFALDDFGTGYNSEKNLLELMPHYVKMDISLVRDVDKHHERQSLLRGLISFAHEKKMIVLAEGVETTEELQCLMEMDVDMLQGYLFARPSDHPNEINSKAIESIRIYRTKKKED